MSNNIDYKIELEEFRFPQSLGDDKSDFRLIVDFRYQHDELGYLVKSVVMPSLDLYWECSVRDIDSPYSPERELVRASRENNSVDIQRVGDWGKVFRIQAIGLYEMRVRVFDVKHRSWWRFVLDKGGDFLMRFVRGRFMLGSDIEEKVASLMVGLAEQKGTRLLFTGSIKAPEPCKQGGCWSIRSPHSNLEESYVIKFKVSPE